MLIFLCMMARPIMDFCNISGFKGYFCNFICFIGVFLQFYWFKRGISIILVVFKGIFGILFIL